MPLYACTVLLSAFLLFLVQPIIAKLILPWFGGSAAVWIVCLVFFQSVLLLGYLYAHGVTRLLRPRGQSILHICLLFGSLLLLPISPADSWKPTGGADPTWRILALLTVCVGLPYFLLSATTPLVQAWYARNNQTSLPYRLFSFSNLASLLALISYPTIIEPRTHTHPQAIAWSAAYALFAALCGVLAWKNRAVKFKTEDVQPAAIAPSWKLRTLWLLLSACGSMLLLAITNHLTQNVAAVPFLWAVPLVLYLLTFILSFGKRIWFPRGFILRLLAVALGSMAYLMYETGFAHLLQVGIPLFCFGLFVACLFCHSELSHSKPEPRHLTLFYVLISLGGAMGAMFVGLAAPRLFKANYELPLVLLLTAALAFALTWKDGWGPRLLWSVATAAMLVLTVVVVQHSRFESVVMMRNFYGSLRVLQSGTGDKQLRTLYHGTIAHGSQFQSLPLRLKPTTYYASDSGAGLTLLACCISPKHVGIIGLGAGSLAAYGRAGDHFRFYEINPQVEQVASSEFSYLRDSQAKVDVIPGDARLSLEREPAQNFDVLLVDAFSGDAIPVHLLTKEAVSLYLRHLKPAGVLGFHISNSYLDLAPVVRQLAGIYGKRSILIHNDANKDVDENAADWVLVASPDRMQSLAEEGVSGHPVIAASDLQLWTDDYSSLLQVLK